MRGSFRIIGVVLIAIALGSIGSQGSQGSEQQPTFRAGVNVVRVDVIVADESGRPVPDLKAEDFKVTEGGKEQPIQTFKRALLDGGLLDARETAFVPIRTDEDEQFEAARDDVRLFAMFLDDYHVKKSSSDAMRQQLARFVDTQLGPSDMIGLMSPVEELSAVRMTRDHDVIRRALEQFEGRKYDHRPKTTAEEKYVYTTRPASIEDVRNCVSFTAIKALIRRMGLLKEGRKALILVSEGYSSGGSLPAHGPEVDYGQLASTACRDVLTELLEIADLARRNNVALYPVDPRGRTKSEFGADPLGLSSTDAVLTLADGYWVHFKLTPKADEDFLNTTMDTLRTLAEASHGQAIVNRNDVAIAMKQIVVDSSVYYLLGYNSTLAKPDGKYHPIQVSLKVKRPGVTLRHRPGYWAMQPDDEARISAAAAAPRPSVTATALATTLDKSAAPRSRTIRTWMGMERGANGLTRVTFVWEPMALVPGEAARDSERPARVVLTAAGIDGPEYFRGVIPSPGSAPSGSRVSFEARPGRMPWRLSVEGPSGVILDSQTGDLTVPDLTSPQTAFATPQLFLARSLPELQRLKEDRLPIPSVRREFSRTDRLLLRVAVYGPSGTLPSLKAVLLNRSGQIMLELPISPAVSQVVAQGFSPAFSQIELSLANLSPSDYGISLAASGESGDATELVAFRVTN